jgi:hypothetical protein
MATDLTGLTVSSLVSIQIASQKARVLSTPEDATAFSRMTRLTFGTGASKSNITWADTRALALSTSETLDLSSGGSGGTALTNAFGVAVLFAKIKLLCIVNSSDLLATPTTADLVVGKATSNAWVGPFDAGTDTITIPAGGVLLLSTPSANGWPVTAGSADCLKIDNIDGAQASQYNIIIIGESA